jgi:Holliday junction resolvasome RuvABC endonuclease subunit
MVCTHLGLHTPPEPDDVTDALALALVYALRARSVPVLAGRR